MNEPYYCWAIKHENGTFVFFDKETCVLKFGGLFNETAFYSEEKRAKRVIKNFVLEDCEPVQIKMQIAPNW